jgi:predicted permease
VLARVERVPGVSSAGVVNVLPFSTYDDGTRIAVDGAPPPEPGREPTVSYRVASARYHEAMRIPLVEGRFFDSRDTPEGARVALVNRALADRHFGSTTPLGRRVRAGGADSPWLTIIGVVGNVRHSTLADGPEPELYVPLAQAPAALMMLAARSAARAEDLTGPIRAAIHDVDAAQPVYHVKTLDTLVGESMLPSRVMANLVTLFSVLALVLAAIGVYGVVAYGVSQQAREFGVRMALGAAPRDVLGLVLRGGAWMVGAGITLGLAGALGVSRLMGSVLYGVSPTDPATYLGAAALLGLIGLAACTVPAWRASTTRPLNALRVE